MNLNFKNRNVVTLIAFGVFVHALILKAVFDIYFSSPIDHGMTTIKSTNHPPAKRLVLIVADGLRAEAIFGSNQTGNAPYLNAIRKSRGSWGVSHTRVPTESRPGHVALLGGIYEDPAAILKGWKMNPVDFDSVINQSTNAWCWGAPTIINMFNKDNLPHIHLYSYNSSMEDFGNNNTIALDSWVFNQVKGFIEKQIDCDECKEFKQLGNLFFLHLLGTDTAGHAFKPESDGYKNNIKNVDENIPNIEEFFEYAFPDKSTAYIFTADHGMTNWGSHGSGSDHETKTPLIAWGAGIKIDKKQRDVRQIDVASLMSALIGINYPINSLGKLPVNYIDTSLDNLSEMVISNVLQLMETFNIKRYRRMNNALHFVPYQGVTTEDLEKEIDYLRKLASLEEYDSFFNESERFMQFLIDGADYYHNYYQLPLLISITVGIVAWIIYLATYNINTAKKKHTKVFIYIQIFLFGPLYLNAALLIKVQSLPTMYYLYLIFPIFMVQIISSRYNYILEALRQVKDFGFQYAICHIFLYLIGLRLLVQGFHNREAFAITMYIMAGSVFYSEALKVHTTKHQKLIWICSCVVLSFFPFLPVMKTSFNIISYLTGYALWWISVENLVLSRLRSNKIIHLQHLMFKLTPIYQLSVEYGIIGNESVLKYVAWFWAFFPMFLVPLTTTQIFPRITSIFIGFGTFYLMVTSNYENLFLFSYIFLLYSWLIIESRSFGYTTITKTRFDGSIRENQYQTSDDFRRAFFFVILIFVGFFGTGNIASLNSFDPMWVRCFITTFSPFKMAGLILLRVMVPFMYTSSVYRAINVFCRGNTLNMFCSVLMFSDLMLLELLYYITNIGSWLEIGMSLSHFIIMEIFVIMLLMLYGFAYLLTTTSFKFSALNKLYY